MSSRNDSDLTKRLDAVGQIWASSSGQLF